MVRLEQRGAVAAEAQLYEPVARGMRVDEGRQVVGNAPVHGPLRIQQRMSPCVGYEPSGFNRCRKL